MHTGIGLHAEHEVEAVHAARRSAVALALLADRRDTVAPDVRESHGPNTCVQPLAPRSYAVSVAVLVPYPLAATAITCCAEPIPASCVTSSGAGAGGGRRRGAAVVSSAAR